MGLLAPIVPVRFTTLFVLLLSRRIPAKLEGNKNSLDIKIVMLTGRTLLIVSFWPPLLDTTLQICVLYHIRLGS
jgi:hypothetical protein